MKRCVKAIENEIEHQKAGKRKTLNLACCKCLKEIVKRAGRQAGRQPPPQPPAQLPSLAASAARIGRC